MLFVGDNILAVLQYLATSEELAHSTLYRHGSMVFFDVLGLFAVAYPKRIGTIINCLVAAATVLYLGRKFSVSKTYGKTIFFCYLKFKKIYILRRLHLVTISNTIQYDTI